MSVEDNVEGFGVKTSVKTSWNLRIVHGKGATGCDLGGDSTDAEQVAWACDYDP